MFTRIVLTVGLAGLLVAPARAEGLREVDQTIFGMDCAPCAAGVEQGLRKLQGVTSVRVSLNEGKAIVSLGANSPTTLAQIREVIRHNGFTPKDARATLDGRLVREGDRLWIQAGKERFVLQLNSGAPHSPVSGEGMAQESKLSVRIPERLANPPTVELLSQQSGS